MTKKRIILTLSLPFIMVIVLMLPGVGTNKSKAWDGSGEGTKENPWVFDYCEGYFDNKDESLHFKGNCEGSLYVYNNDISAFKDIKDQVKTIYFDGVNWFYSDYVSIKGKKDVRGAFEDFSQLESVVFSNVGSRILFGSETFKNCQSLKNVIILDKEIKLYVSDYAFEECISLEEIKTPEDYIEFSGCEKGAFYDCSKLKGKIRVEPLVEGNYIGEKAFYQCNNITSVSFSDYVHSVGEYAFFKCSSLKEIEFPEIDFGVSKYSFCGCSSLERLSFPNTNFGIGEGAFSGCTSLKEVILSEKYIGELSDYAFNECTSLEKIVIPSNYSKIGNYAFKNCSNLKEVQIKNGINTIGNGSFYACTSLEKIYFPSGIWTVGEEAFYQCTSLKEIDFSMCVLLKSIGNKAFYKCLNVNTLAFSSKQAKLVIGTSAFRDMSLKAVTFPDTVTSIGKYAFSGNKLKSIIFEGSNTLLEDYALGSGIEANFVAPSGSEDSYQYKLIDAGIIRSDSDIYVNKHKHYFDWESVDERYMKSEATCTSPAVFFKSCDCGEASLTDTFLYGNMKQHVFDQKVINNKYLKTKADCTNAAKYYYSCVCGEKGSNTFQNGKPKGHTWDEGVITKDPTPTETGIKKYTCVECYDTKTVKIPKKQMMKRELIEAFVSRMYTKALGREAEPDGLKYWADQLEGRIDDGANVAYGFITSNEFKGRNLSDDQFIETMYMTFFDRAFDSEGKNYWMNLMQSGTSRESVLAGFVKSQEFETLCTNAGIERGLILDDGKPVNSGIYQFVKRQYSCCLQREGEREGMDYWAKKIATHEVTAVDVAKEFFFSNEFVNKGLNDSQYIERLYVTFLDRPFDPIGYEYWNDKISRGETRKEILEEFASSEEFQGILRSYGL